VPALAHALRSVWVFRQAGPVPSSGTKRAEEQSSDDEPEAASMHTQPLVAIGPDVRRSEPRDGAHAAKGARRWPGMSATANASSARAQAAIGPSNGGATQSPSGGTQSGAPTSAIHPAVAVPSDQFRSVMMGSFAGGKRGEVVRWEMCDVDDALRPDRRAGSRHDDRATRARPPDNPRLRSAAEMTTLGRPAHRDHRTSKTARHTVHCAGAGRELALPTAPRRDSPPQGRRAMTVPIGSEWQ
jgi:hypothetical protein